MKHKKSNRMVVNEGRNRVSGTGRNGFTLIEVMLAIAVFSLGVLTAASTQVNSVWTTTALRKTSMAAECAADVMERLFLLNFNHGDLTVGSHLPGDMVDPAGDGDDVPVVPEYNAVFSTIQWTVADNDLDADGTIDAKLITVTVSWGGGRRVVLNGIRTLRT